ncbi:PaaI family thioesterase [Sedimenticola selenatireducens]|uniref:PaaI family thioesterase n=1 Tax=Sedimenticola selenatireducens TaxID=191960 RepID=A0A557SJV7_9GAMM|nr:PaaI family thioesterase [Sedimenticola selenatireducens]TVO77711.1 PaaI family thioesterase [Sedimenticola selenatireducens]TVT65017.1 MAG: PaaI family thioesterase [Sedimenticola selenatireducens]
MTADAKALYPLDGIQSILEKLPHVEALGLTAIELNRGSCLFKVDYAPHLVGNIESGVIHGGVITTLLDSAGGAAAFTVVPAGASVATLDLRIDYLTQADRERSILGFAECYRQTQHIVFVKGHAYHESRDDPIAHFVASFMVGSVGFSPNAKQ